MSRDQIVGHTDSEIYPQPIAAAYRENDLEAMRSPHPIQRDEPFVGEGEEVRTCRVVKFPIVNESQEVLSLCGVAIDITDSLRAEHARTDERGHLARELHDDAMQVMATAALRLENLERDSPASQKEALAELRVMVLAALERLRVLTSDLNIPREGVDLSASLTDLLSEVERDRTISYSFEDRLGYDLHPMLAAGLYRIAREAILNSATHSQASRIDVTIAAADGGVEIAITDDGVGFHADSERSEEHMGIRSMQARAHSLGGQLRIIPGPDRGTRVEVWLPEMRTGRSSSDDE
jgi:signal transduction histidine kinase